MEEFYGRPTTIHNVAIFGGMGNYALSCAWPIALNARRRTKGALLTGQARDAANRIDQIGATRPGCMPSQAQENKSQLVPRILGEDKVDGIQDTFKRWYILNVPPEMSLKHICLVNGSEIVPWQNMHPSNLEGAIGSTIGRVCVRTIPPSWWRSSAE